MCVKQVLKGSVLGGLAAFAWINISWMVLPFHQATIHNVANEPAMAQALVQNIQKPGVYVLPGCPGDHSSASMEATMAKKAQGPMAFMVVRPGAKAISFPMMMLKELLLDMLMCGLFSVLLAYLRPGLRYIQKVGVLMLASVAVGTASTIPNWIWWEFPTQYTAVMFLDCLMVGLISSLVIAKVVRLPEESA